MILGGFIARLQAGFGRLEGRSGGRFAGRFAGAEAGDGARAFVLAGGVVGSLLLIIAEFTSLLVVHVNSSSVPLKTVGTGSHNFFALIPIALVCGALAYAFFREGTMAALLGIGGLSVVALLIALVGDLPDAHASGLAGSASTHYVLASSSPSAGFYLETLGAIALLLSAGGGLLLLRTPGGSGGEARPRAGRGSGSRSGASAGRRLGGAIGRLRGRRAAS